MEDTFFATVTKAAPGRQRPLQGPWDQVLARHEDQGHRHRRAGNADGRAADGAGADALRDGRAPAAKPRRRMLDGYAALVSGVLIGMSDGLQSGKADATAAKTAKK